MKRAIGFLGLHTAVVMAASTEDGHAAPTEPDGDGITKTTGASQVPTGQIDSDLKSTTHGSAAMFAAPTEAALGRDTTTDTKGVDVEEESGQKIGGGTAMLIGDGLKSTQIGQAPCWSGV